MVVANKIDIIRLMYLLKKKNKIYEIALTSNSVCWFIRSFVPPFIKFRENVCCFIILYCVCVCHRKCSRAVYVDQLMFTMNDKSYFRIEHFTLILNAYILMLCVSGNALINNANEASFDENSKYIGSNHCNISTYIFQL